jgi:hypothetical protein
MGSIAEELSVVVGTVQFRKVSFSRGQDYIRSEYSSVEGMQ